MSQLLSVQMSEGRVRIDPRQAPSPDALFETLRGSRTPVCLFDFESARLTHVNPALERFMDLSASEFIGGTGRQMMPGDGAVLTEVISRALRAERRYEGPTLLQHGGAEAVRARARIEVLRHGERLYGVDWFRPLPPATARRRRLLVADDEAIMRRALWRAFCADAEVVLAADAYEAIRHLADDASIGAVVSDVDMPGGGCALYRACRLLRPELCERFLFYSGRLGPLDLDDEVPRVMKGSDPRQLRERVLALLG